MASSQVQGKAALENDEEKARAMSISTNDPKFNTPLIPASAAVLIVHASTRITAPASLVFRTLRNTETWRDWNNFVPRVTIRSQPPENADLATDAEIADLILNTSRLVSMDSDITDGAAPPPKKAVSPPRRASTENSRRASVASGKPADGVSGAQRYAQTQAARRASTASGASATGVSPAVAGAIADLSTSSPRAASPAPAKLVETSSPARGGVLIQHGSTNANGRKVSTSLGKKRLSSLNAMYGEPSIRLKLNTAMTFHCRMHLPSRPGDYKDVHLIVTEVSRPDDVQNGYDDPDTGLTRSTTHTLSRSGVYRIVWGTDHKADRTRPKFMLTSQWVVDVRPVMRGDGKEDSEITIWESLKGIQASGLKKQQGYLFDMFTGWVLGLRDYCEAMGGAVERRDFFKEQGR